MRKPCKLIQHDDWRDGLCKSIDTKESIDNLQE